MRKAIVAAAGVTLVLLAGCSSTDGGGAPSPAAGGGKDPCSLLTDDQLTKAFGKPPKSHKPTLDITNGCAWSFGEVGEGSLTIYVNPAAAVERRITSDMEPLPDVGDKAAWSDTSAVIFAIAGGTGLHVTLSLGVKDGDAGTPAWKARQKQAGISATRNAFAALGVGKPDDAAVPTATSKSSNPASTTTPSTKTESTEPPDTSEPSTSSEPETSESSESSEN